MSYPAPAVEASQRIDLGAGAWLALAPGFLTPAAAQALLSTARQELRWEQREVVIFGRRVSQPRLIAWAGSLPYRYSGLVLEPRPAPPPINHAAAAVSEAAGVSFNHLLANRYRDGTDSMGLHADAEPELGPDPAVATLSLGASRRFVLKARRGGERRVLELGDGSLLLMGGTCQRHWVHGVPRTATAGERISLTFRMLLRPPA